MKKTSVVIESLKPRNPYALAARQRVAGSHRPSVGARRQQAERELRRESAQVADQRSSP